jgi:hypothetical protein
MDSAALGTLKEVKVPSSAGPANNTDTDNGLPVPAITLLETELQTRLKESDV